MQAIDLNKYRSQAALAPVATVQTGRTYAAWMHRPAVVLLVEYLKMNQGKGMFLYRDGGGFGLRFHPPLTKNDRGGDRFTVAEHLYDFLYEAVDDLTDLINQGEPIPFLRRISQRAAGPP